MNRVIAMVVLGVLAPTLAGCALFSSKTVPPAPKLTGMKAERLAWHDAIHVGRHGGTPTFEPLSAAEKAVQSAKSQPQVDQFDTQSLSQAEQSLTQAKQDWQAIADKKHRSDDALAKVAFESYRAERLAEIAQYTAQRGLGQKKLQALQAQARRARRKQAASQSAVTRAGNQDLVGRRVVPEMLGALQFQSGTARLTKKSRPVVGRLAKLLGQHPKLGVAIFGFTNNRAPSDQRLQAFVNANKQLQKKHPSQDQKVQAYHQALSQARARDVAQLLVRAGVSAQRIGTRGMGASHPIASNDTAAGRQHNERAEAILVPLKKQNGGG